jgi:uncharacterized protein (TIGR02678 family)
MNDEERRAARALLANPLLHADPGSPEVRAEELRLVRKHRVTLQAFFSSGLGYRLVVDRAAARLVKLDPGAEPPRPLLRGTQRRPMSPRGYSFLALLLGVLDGGRRQYLVDELVREVRATATEAGVVVDLDSLADRRALHAALTVLIGFGVLRERDGDLARWAEDTRAQSLLDVSEERLALVVTGLPRVTTVEDLLQPDLLPSAVGGARLATRRRLVESPLLDVEELDDEQRDWWMKNRGRERDWYEDSLGLRLELRSEGALAIDPDDELTDVTFPGAGSARHLALLVLEKVVRLARQGRAARVVVDAVDVESAHAHVIAEHPAALNNAYRDDAQRLRLDVANVLRSTGLVHVLPDGSWGVHAAAARYAPKPTVVAATLFEEIL